MSTGMISPAFIASFDAEVKAAYQGMSKLAGTVRQKNGVVGSSHRFTIISKGMAALHTPHADVTPMGINYSTATATLADFAAPEYSDIFQQSKINFDEKRELVKCVAGALGRRFDQANIDAIFAGAPAANTLALNLGASDAFNMAKLRGLGQIMDANGVPSSDRHIAWTAAAKAQLLGSTAATSSDFNSVQALVRGDLNAFYGFNFHLIEDRNEGGIPLDTATSANRQILAWHKDAVGCAVSMNQSTEINYVPEKLSWLVTGKISLGCVAIDTDGIAIAQVLESVVI